MHKAAATQSQRPTCGPPDAHRVSTVHPTRSWRREDRSHSQLWPHITACEMPTVRATTPPRSARRHSQRRRGALDAPTSEAYKGPGRAARRAPNGQGRRGGPYTRGPPPPQRGRHRVDDSGANKSSALGNASASGCSASQHPTKPEQPSARTAQVLWGSTKHHPPKQTLTSATKVDTSSRASLFDIHSSLSLQNR